jgi:hypothetical protein
MSRLLLLLSLTIILNICSCGNRTGDKNPSAAGSDSVVIPQENPTLSSEDTGYSTYLKFIHNDSLKCNTEVLIPITKNLRQGTLTDEEIYLFLRTFSTLCSRDAEYSEYSNELLFDMLNLQPERVIINMEREKRNIDIDYIIHELETPVNDGIDVKTIYVMVKNVKNNSKLKKDILKSLDIAKANLP